MPCLCFRAELVRGKRAPGLSHEPVCSQPCEPQRYRLSTGSYELVVNSLANDFSIVFIGPDEAVLHRQ